VSDSKSSGPRPDPTPTQSERFAVGQVWRYRTRPGEEGSRVMVGRIESIGECTVVHVKLVGLRIANRSAPGGVSSFMAHTPLAESNLSASVIELTSELADLGGFEDGYQTWLDIYRTERGGFFTVELDALVGYVESVLNPPDA
jgi:hypothetical protein